MPEENATGKQFVTMVLCSLFDLCPELVKAVERMEDGVWVKALDEAYEDVDSTAEAVIQKRVRQGR